MELWAELFGSVSGILSFAVIVFMLAMPPVIFYVLKKYRN